MALGKGVRKLKMRHRAKILKTLLRWQDYEPEQPP